VSDYSLLKLAHVVLAFIAIGSSLTMRSGCASLDYSSSASARSCAASWRRSGAVAPVMVYLRVRAHARRSHCSEW
jgi:hypothetical protein